MKRFIAIGAALVMTLVVAAGAMAAGNASKSKSDVKCCPVTAPPTASSGNSIVKSGATAVVRSGATAMPGRTAVAGATVTTSGSTGTTYGTGRTGSAGTGTTVGVSGSTGVSSTTRVAPVVPSGASNAGTTYNGSTPTVTYRVGSSYYHVTYLPSGRYSYSVNGSPNTFSVSGTFAGGGGISTIGGTSVLPRTGGGNAPSFPSLPAVIGLALATAGVLARRFKRP